MLFLGGFGLCCLRDPRRMIITSGSVALWLCACPHDIQSRRYLGDMYGLPPAEPLGRRRRCGGVSRLLSSDCEAALVYEQS